ncbi:Uncharacterised protein [Vibrio cholerae]|nr:Uncharacterised protein [Vibrio cholerae]
MCGFCALLSQNRAEFDEHWQEDELRSQKCGISQPTYRSAYLQ